MNAGISVRERLARLVLDRSFRQPLLVFAITRLLVLAIFILGGAAALDTSKPGYDPADPHPVVSLPHATSIEHLLARGDSGWYMSIAQGGYERATFDSTQPHNWVFFPLYPLLVGFGGALTGSYLIFGALLSNAFLLVALVLLHRLVSALGYDPPTADRAVFYTAIFPVSYFFSLPVTEALFLCLTVGSFLAAARGHWWAAGLLGGLASGTRLSGLLLLPALAIFYWQQRPVRMWRRDLLWLALVPSGVLAFMLFMWRITGNAMAFIDAIAAWDRKSGFFLAPLFEYLTHPLRVIEPWDFRLLNFASGVLALAAVAFWARRRQWALAALTLMAIFLPLSSGRLQSIARYTSVIFPVFIALAIVGRRPWIDQAIRIVFLVLFGIMTLCFALRFSFAAA